MEEKVAIKKSFEVKERPYANNKTDSPNKTEDSSFHNNTLGSTLLSLSLQNSSEQLPHQVDQGLQPQNQMGMLRAKLEEEKKENENLRGMLNLVNERCIALQNRLLLAMQLHQLSSSPQNNRDLLKGSRQDHAEKPVLPTRQFLNIGEPSPYSSDCSKTTEGFASAENFEKGRRSLACYEYENEGDINSQITSQERIEDQAASEGTCRRARVSIRARSEFSLMGDGCHWRKYGQKTAKGNPCPRAYYRCSMGTACPVRKQVQRCFKDETVFITTYEGNHNHPLPPAARPMASLTSTALNMFLSGSSTTSLNCSNTLSNTLLFSSTLTTPPSTAIATFSQSALCPTVTLDFTLPNNVPTTNNNYLQFQKASTPLFPFPLMQGGYYPQTISSDQGLYNLCDYSKAPITMISTPEKKLALVDVVSEAIAKDPSLKEALFAAVSSLTTTNGDPLNNINNHSQPSKSGNYDPCSKMNVIPPHQPCSTTQLI